MARNAYKPYTVVTQVREYTLLVKHHTMGWIVKVQGDVEDDAKLYLTATPEEAIANHSRTHASGEEVIRTIRPQ